MSLRSPSLNIGGDIQRGIESVQDSFEQELEEEAPNKTLPTIQELTQRIDEIPPQIKESLKKAANGLYLAASRNTPRALRVGLASMVAFGWITTTTPDMTREVEASGPDTYAVHPGDTLYEIASVNGISYRELLRANPQINNPNQIYVGQKVIIPGDAISQNNEVETDTSATIVQEPTERISSEMKQNMINSTVRVVSYNEAGEGSSCNAVYRGSGSFLTDAHCMVENVSQIYLYLPDGSYLHPEVSHSIDSQDILELSVNPQVGVLEHMKSTKLGDYSTIEEGDTLWFVSKRRGFSKIMRVKVILKNGNYEFYYVSGIDPENYEGVNVGGDSGACLYNRKGECVGIHQVGLPHNDFLERHEIEVNSSGGISIGGGRGFSVHW